MTEVSTFRLYLLRGTYLLIAVGLGSQIWPIVLGHAHPFAHMQGVAFCLLAAVSVLAAIGVRYPLQMLPLLLFELFWKSLWLLVVALPLWRANAIDPVTAETVKACLMGVIFPIVIPWPYVVRHYLLKRGDRWGSTAPAA